LIAKEKARARVLLEWAAKVKATSDQSNSPDILITVKNLEEFLLYEWLTIAQVVSQTEGPKALKDNGGLLSKVSSKALKKVNSESSINKG
jgi:hypothetical protein